MSAGMHPQVITVITPAAAHAAVQPCTGKRPTADEICKAAGISRRMFFLALKVNREGCPEVERMVIDGKLTLSLAAELCTLFPCHADQRTLIAEFADMPPRKWAAFARTVAELGGIL